ncbi:MAG: phosphoribosylamine--glycine ligase [Alphaproteobacteria bacterium]|nr:phosphoribosylamine--glycine ligase [Alphaproteobacteria bacterium]
MRILVVGSGGREHALCWAIAASPLCDALYCAPGNAGIADVAICVDIGQEDLPALVGLAQREKIDFVVVGPEAPLVAGLADRFAAAGIKVFGPSSAAARLEGSKSFTKDLCRKYGIPTASYERFGEVEAARAYIRRQGNAWKDRPIVVKADGLAAGKGVIIAATQAEAIAAVEDMLSGQRFGAAGSQVVIEEFLQGEEASFFALVDGAHALPLVAAQDHKRVGDGDTGPNTGGMGAYSPAPCVTPQIAERVMDEIVRPTVRAMAAEGAPYRGVLFAGLMLTPGGPKLIEYNCRFGDPECQVLMMRLKSDLLPALIATADGGLAHFDLRWHDETALTVVMAANGYPDAPQRGTEIRGLDQAAAVEGVTIFHAGTRRDGARLLANGGRVLNVTAMAATVAEARRRAYAAVDRIDWPGGFCRRDIAWRALDAHT